MMQTNQLPKMTMEAPKTGCCPEFDSEAWDEQELEFVDKLFAKASTFNIMHIPLNMGPVIQSAWKKIQAAEADWKEGYLILSNDPSPWRGDHYFAVTKEVPDLDMVKMSGTFLTKVYEGPYDQAGKWVSQMNEYVNSQGKEVKDLYFFYTTCPKCVKVYGKNYVVALAKV